MGSGAGCRCAAHGKASIALALVALVAACGDGAVAPGGPAQEPQEPELAVTLGITPDTVSPGDSTVVAVEAVVRPASLTLDDFELIFEGPLDTVLPLPVPGPGSQKIMLYVLVARGPVHGVLSITAWARVGSLRDSVTDTLTVWDRKPPVVLGAVDRDRVEPGDTVLVEYEAIDNAGLLSTALSVTGAATFTEVLALAGALRHEGSHKIAVPPTARLGDSLLVEVTASDVSGLADTAQLGAVEVDDLRRPTLSASLAPTGYPPSYSGLPQYVRGETVQIDITAEDERSLAWIGFVFPTFAGVADSSPVSGFSASLSREVVVQSDWESRGTAITAFAVDASGNRSTVELEVSFFDGVRRPYTTPTIPRYLGWINDIAHDPKRDLLYISISDTSHIKRFSLSTLQLLDPIPIPGLPRGLDLTVGGDSLVVALRGSSHIAVVDLRGPAFPVDTVQLLGFDPARWQLDVQVAINNEVLVSWESASAVIIDLASGAQRRVDWPWRLVRSGDRRTVVALSPGWSSVGPAIVYRPLSGSVQEFWAAMPLLPVLNHDGTYQLSDGELYDMQFTRLRDLDSGFKAEGTPSFSTDGVAAYFAARSDFSYRKVQVSDGSLLERVLTPLYLTRVMVLPGDQVLLAFAGDEAIPVAIFDIR
jgi:hypothetical protein